MAFVTLAQSKGTSSAFSSPISFLVYLASNFTQYRKSHSVNMVDWLVEVSSKPEFSEASHIDFYSHVSWINNSVSEDKLDSLGTDIVSLKCFLEKGLLCLATGSYSL